MEANPWQVECIEVFSHFICPECPFLTKEKDFFKDHAENNHPLSCALFGSTIKEERSFFQDHDRNNHQLDQPFCVTEGEGIESPSNPDDSELDEKLFKDESPKLVKGTKTINFSTADEINHLKSLTEAKLNPLSTDLSTSVKGTKIINFSNINELSSRWKRW